MVDKTLQTLVGADGGGVPINSITTLRSTEIIFMDGDSEYLRSGYIQTDVSIYPDATRSVGASLGVTHPVIDSPTSTCFDGTYHWVGTRASTTITQYNSSWTPTGLTINIGIKPRGLTWDAVNSNFWAVQDEVSSKVVRKYSSAWAYLGLEIDVSARELYPRGVAVDGVYVYIVGTDTDSVYRWTVAGAYVDNFFSVSSVTGVPADILIIDSKFWITSRYSQTRGGVIAEFGETGIPTGRRFSPVGDSSAMDFDGTYFWTTRYDGTVWQYSGEYVGLPQFEPSGNGVKYMRVK